MSVFYNIFILI